ncbi:hypothetical protein CKM354_001171500 [Cercospora kikuchii]|uniref:Terpene synthase n=1 Tax=Cercospora kikuchii TaxID=84275 RepID=A0A9P3CTH9_9PEZI|nr:uncharacterized protein CKM354_001171500 [Cercospora kikuchii]GIZ48664.1 hypothetical protein CKM354_001171500 [Cercospora kikuchii]
MAPSSEYITIKLPELFVGFLADEPDLHPRFEEICRESDEAVCRACKYDSRVCKIVQRGDFCRFVAIAAPHASETQFRTYCDWVNWVFPYDDLFDNGYLRADLNNAKAKMVALFAGTNDKIAHRAQHDVCDLVEFHDDIWRRLRATAPPGVQKRFLKTLRHFCDAVLDQVGYCSTDRVPTIDEILATRRQSAGVAPLFPLFEFANLLHLPDTFFEAPATIEMQNAAMDSALLQNDMLSYQKEESEGVPHNAVAVSRMRGMSAQGAFDYVGQMLEERLELMASCIDRLPEYDDAIITRDIGCYVEGVKNTIKANLYWSFTSKRYFGEGQELVKKTRQLKVMRHPPFMNM